MMTVVKNQKQIKQRDQFKARTHHLQTKALPIQIQFQTKKQENSESRQYKHIPKAMITQSSKANSEMERSNISHANKSNIHLIYIERKIKYHHVKTANLTNVRHLTI